MPGKKGNEWGHEEKSIFRTGYYAFVFVLYVLPADRIIPAQEAYVVNPEKQDTLSRFER
jgi:hypothetical protein